MVEIQEKQQYLRSNIKSQYYEQFAQFCETECGQVNLQEWSLTYLQQLVVKFKSQLQKQQDKVQIQKSFSVYQTAKMDEIKEISFAVLNHIKEINLKDSQIKKQEKQIKNINTTNKNSAVDLLDSIFQERNNQNSSSKQQQFQSVGQQYFNSINFNTKNNSSTFHKKPITPNDFKWDYIEKQKKKQKKEEKIIRTNTHEKSKSNFDFNLYVQNIKNVPEFKGVVTGAKKVIAYDQKNRPYMKNNPYAGGEIPLNFSKQQFTKKATQNSRKTISISTPQKQIQKKSQVRTNQPPTKCSKSPTASDFKSFNSVPLKPSTNQIVQRQKKSKQFQDVVNCFQTAVRQPLSSQKLNVSINKYEIIKRSFIMPDYVMYFVTVSPMGHICKRNYEDFQKLRNGFQKFYPTIQLPYLIKNGWFSQSSVENILKQATYLQMFLKRIIQNQELRNSRIFEDFLTIKEHKVMKRKFEQYEKIDKPKSIQQLCLLKGRVTVGIDEDMNNYHEKIEFYLKNLSYKLELQQKLSEQLSYYYKQAGQTLKKLKNIFPQIIQLTDKLNIEINLKQIRNFKHIFYSIQEYYTDVLDQMKFRNNIIDSKVVPFINFEKNNLQTFNHIIETTNQMKKSYQKRKNSQTKSQRIQYTNERLKSFKTGIFQESKNLVVLRYQTGFLNTQLCSEAQRMLELMGDNYKDLWKILRSDNYQRCKATANKAQMTTSLNKVVF